MLSFPILDYPLLLPPPDAFISPTSQIFVLKQHPLPRVPTPTFPHHRCFISYLAGVYPFMAVSYTTGLIVAIHLAFGAFICLFLLMAKKLHGSTHKCSNPFSRLIPRRSRSELPVTEPQPLSKYEAYSMDKQNPAQYYPYVGTNARLTTPVAAWLPFPQN